MRISHTDSKEELLKDVTYTAWRFVHRKEELHREHVNKTFNARPRYRHETQH